MTEQQLMMKIDKLENSIEGLKEEVDYMKNILEDSVLTATEERLVENTINKIKKGDKSDFVSLDQSRKSNV